MALAMGLDRFQRLAFRTISQTGIRYPKSPLAETVGNLAETAPRAGDRFPWLRLKLQSPCSRLAPPQRLGGSNDPVEDLFQKLDDRRFNLIVFGQVLPPGELLELGDLLRIHAVPSDPANDRELARAQIPQPSFYLLRPDGYIGLAGTHLDAAALTRYVSERLRIATEIDSVHRCRPVVADTA
jgi:hypothetical protein